MSNYANHSIKGVLNISLPLTISSLSSGLMITFDRLMLAKFDLNIMNAVVSIGMLLFLFDWIISSITVTTEVFSGQYNGLDKKTMTPVATWQMLLFSLLTIGFYVPVGLFLGKYIIPEVYYKSAGTFFKIAACFLVFAPAIASINGFFIGIKKTKIILINSIVGNTINIILSYNLIFGIEGVIEPLGAMGAAIATSMSLFLQFVIIFSVFLSKKYHTEYETRNYFFDNKIFNGCLKLGVPNSVGLVAEDIGNYVLQIIILYELPQYVSNNNIGINISIIIFFFLWGLQKAVGGLAANIIGEKKLELIPKLFKSVLIVHSVVSIGIFLTFILLPDSISQLYTEDQEVIHKTKLTLPWVAIHYYISGIGWLICAIISSGGDTRFVMIINICATWLFRVVPIYILLKLDIEFAAIGWAVATLSGIMLTLLAYLRFKSNKWLKLKLS